MTRGRQTGNLIGVTAPFAGCLVAIVLAMELVGLAWNVVRISPERQAAKAAAGT